MHVTFIFFSLLLVSCFFLFLFFFPLHAALPRLFPLVHRVDTLQLFLITMTIVSPSCIEGRERKRKERERGTFFLVKWPHCLDVTGRGTVTCVTSTCWPFLYLHCFVHVIVNKQLSLPDEEWEEEGENMKVQGHESWSRTSIAANGHLRLIFSLSRDRYYLIVPLIIHCRPSAKVIIRQVKVYTQYNIYTWLEGSSKCGHFQLKVSKTVTLNHLNNHSQVKLLKVVN